MLLVKYEGSHLQESPRCERVVKILIATTVLSLGFILAAPPFAHTVSPTGRRHSPLPSTAPVQISLCTH
jgi:hypothetical protein